MKRFSIIIAISLCSSLCFAQLKVYQNGNVGIGCTLTTTDSHLNIGNHTYADTTYNVGLTSSSLLTKQYNIGVDGWAYSDTVANSHKTMGVRGLAGNGTSGYNYGVAGILKGTQNGTAVLGTVNNDNGIDIGGIYAGYFKGDIKSTGVSKMKIANIYDPVSILGPGSISNLEYPFLVLSSIIPVTQTIMANRDDMSDNNSTYDIYDESDAMNDRSLITHFALTTNGNMPQSGLMLTDALQHTYLNYTEIIPLLVAAVQDLDERVNDLQSANSYSMEQTDEINNSFFSAMHNKCTLYQNNPNPFTENTVIKYSVPEDAGDAWLYVFDMQGAMLKQMRLDTKSDRVILQGGDLKPGMYLYSLIVNGKEVDTKRMILSK